MNTSVLEPKLTLDGLMTLAAGVIAFIAVILQIRSSRKSLERQLGEEKDARAAEERARNEAVARALIVEIANFYAYYRTYVRPSLDRVNVDTCSPLPTLSAPGPDFFAVYRGNSGRLGAFEYVLVERVVKFYGLAELLLTSVREYRHSMEVSGSGPVVAGSPPRKLLHQAQTVMYPADEAAISALGELCRVARISVDSLKLPS